MNQTMYIATWDTQIVLVTKRYTHWLMDILSTDASFNIDENSVPHTLKCVWHGQKFQLCTCNLTFTTHESNYVYCYVRFANGFSYKAYSHCAIDILSNGASFNIDENAVPNSLKCVWLGL